MKLRLENFQSKFWEVTEVRVREDTVSLFTELANLKTDEEVKLRFDGDKVLAHKVAALLQEGVG